MVQDQGQVGMPIRRDRNGPQVVGEDGYNVEGKAAPRQHIQAIRNVTTSGRSRADGIRGPRRQTASSIERTHRPNWNRSCVQRVVGVDPDRIRHARDRADLTRGVAAASV